MSSLISGLKELIANSGLNKKQFMDLTKNACDEFKEDIKRNKLAPSSDGIQSFVSEKIPKAPSAYNMFVKEYMKKYQGNPREGMKEAAESWKNGGKEEWDKNHS